jgi:hypothetical protein
MEERIVDYRAQPHQNGCENPYPDFHHDESCSLFEKSGTETCDGSTLDMKNQRAQADDNRLTHIKLMRELSSLWSFPPDL